MSNRYQDEIRRQEQEQRKLEETMRRHPDTQEHDDQLKVQMEWLNRQK